MDNVTVTMPSRDNVTVPISSGSTTNSLTYYCGYCDAWVDYLKPCGHVSRCPVCQTTHFIRVP